MMHVSHFTLPLMKSLGKPSPSRGFSLIELLLVMAVIGLMVTAALPAFNSIAAAHGVQQCAHDVAGVLELARSEAVARQTYVWVGFTATNRSGVDEIDAGAVFSKDGSGTNTASSNLAPLFRVVRCSKMNLISWANLDPANLGSYSNAAPIGVESNSSGLSFSVGQTSFQQKTIGFTPRGEATLAGSIGPDTGFDPLISVSFRQSMGGSSASSPKGAAVVVDGATGVPRILGL